MKTLATVLLLHCACTLFANETPNVKFGKITPADLQKKVYSIDSNANAVVIADIGKSEIEGNSKGWFSLIYTHYKRIHILKKSGYSIADVEIPLYVNGNNEENLNSLKAVTYNLENGQVVETKLEKAGVFTNKYDKNHLLKKFTFPNVKEGSVIEFEYTVSSDFLFNLQPWEFQGKAPRLWSEYNLTLPNFLGYIFLTKGYLPYNINENKSSTRLFNVVEDGGAGASEHYSFNTAVMDYRWAMKDVPELKEENYTSTLENHKSKIEFQLSEFRQPLTPRPFMQSWPQFTEDLLKDEDFGKSLSNANNWLNEDVKNAIGNAKTDIEKARNIFTYVRDNIACTDHEALYISQSLKNVLKNKKGNVSDINLLLTAMLKNANIQADPVMLSTREHGTTYALYPIISQYNYVVCQATINEQIFYLDASHPRLGFGKLPAACYNSTARLINETARAIELRPDSLNETKFTSVFVTNDEKGKWIGSFNQTLGDNESYSVRDKIKEAGLDEFLKKIKKTYSNELTIEHPLLDSLDKYDNPVKIQYDFTLKNNKEDIIYFNPMMAEGYKENPFKSAERLYPVEMPYRINETYLLTLNVPEGYEVDELPKSIRVKLNENNDGMFEYLIARSGSTISLRSTLKLDKATFHPEEYDYLREFFNMVVSKHNEQIVFKKIKK